MTKLVEQGGLHESGARCLEGLKSVDVISLKEARDNPMIAKVLHIVCMLRGRQPTGQNIKCMLNPLTLKLELGMTEPCNLSETSVRAVQNLLNDSKYQLNVTAVKTQSEAAGLLLDWVFCMLAKWNALGPHSNSLPKLVSHPASSNRPSYPPPIPIPHPPAERLATKKSVESVLIRTLRSMQKFKNLPKKINHPGAFEPLPFPRNVSYIRRNRDHPPLKTQEGAMLLGHNKSILWNKAVRGLEGLITKQPRSVFKGQSKSMSRIPQ
jgi:hypothetical protein